MICDNCKIDRLVTDFINKHKYCYRCEYQIKIQEIRKSKTSKPSLCRVCGNKVIYQKGLKKRQRTVFCSCECAQLGHKQLISNHWTRKVHSGR
jgi:hypothetical protein